MEDITQDKDRLAAIAAAAGGQSEQQPEAEPIVAQSVDDAAAAETVQPARKRAVRKKAEESAQPDVPAKLEWEGPTAAIRGVLKRVARVANRTAALPLLSCLLIEWRDGTVYLRATNLDIDVREKVPFLGAGNGGAGTIAVPARQLMALIDRAEQEVRISADLTALRLVVCSAGWKATLSCLCGDDFPPAQPMIERGLLISSRQLAKMLKMTIGATSADETRYVLNGIYMEIGFRGVEMLMVGTDGRRLATISAPLPKQDPAACPVWSGVGSVIVPNPAVAVILGGLSGSDVDPVTVGLIIGERDGKPVVTAMVVRSGFWTCWLKVIEGAYPDYRRVIPEMGADRIKVDMDEFVDMVGRAEAVSTESVMLRFEGTMVVVSATDETCGDWTEVREIISPEHQLTSGSVQMAINPDYVAPLYQTGEGELDLSHAMYAPGPMTWRSAPVLSEGVNGNYTYVIMPQWRSGGGAE